MPTNSTHPRASPCPFLRPPPRHRPWPRRLPPGPRPRRPLTVAPGATPPAPVPAARSSALMPRERGVSLRRRDLRQGLHQVQGQLPRCQTLGQTGQGLEVGRRAHPLPSRRCADPALPGHPRHHRDGPVPAPRLRPVELCDVGQLLPMERRDLPGPPHDPQREFLRTGVPAEVPTRGPTAQQPALRHFRTRTSLRHRGERSASARDQTRQLFSPPGRSTSDSPSRVCSHSRFHLCRSFAASKRFRRTATSHSRTPRQSAESRTELIVPGRSRPPARRGPGQGQVGTRPRVAPCSPRRGQRRHESLDRHPDRRAAPACAPRDRHAGYRRSVRSREAVHVLPTSVPVPTTTTSRCGRQPDWDTPLRARRVRGEAGGSAHRATGSCPRLNTPPTASPAAGSCRPDRGRADGGTHSPCSSKDTEASSAARSEPRTTGMTGLGWSGGTRTASESRSIGPARRPVRASPSAEHRLRSAARRARRRHRPGLAPSRRC